MDFLRSAKQFNTTWHRRLVAYAWVMVLEADWPTASKPLKAVAPPPAQAASSGGGAASSSSDWPKATKASAQKLVRDLRGRCKNTMDLAC
eukprot:10853154-Lingulodinium_polyedra.AAC.1